MIAKIINCRTYHPLVDYLLSSPRMEDPSIVESTLGYTAQDIKDDLDVLVANNPNVRRPAMHMIVAWHPDDQISNEHMAEVGGRLLRGMGYDTNLGGYAIIRHQDEEHDHMHIVASRVYSDGSLYQDKGFPARRLRSIADKIEEEYDFVPAIPKKDRLDIHARKAAERDLLPRDADDLPDDIPSYVDKRIRPARQKGPISNVDDPDNPADEATNLTLTKMEGRSGVRPLKIHTYRAIMDALKRSDGTFESLDEELAKDGRVIPSWSFNKKGDFNGASFTPVDPADGQAFRDPAGEPYSFKGSQLGPRGGLNKGNLLALMDQQAERHEARQAQAARRQAAASDRESARLFLQAARMMRESQRSGRSFSSRQGGNSPAGAVAQVRRILRLMDDRRMRKQPIPQLPMLRQRRR